MARMLIELSEGLYEKLADHVSAGKYRDIDQAIEVAILNQLKLESRESGLLSGEGVAAEPDPRTSPGPTDEQADRAPSDEYLAFLQLPMFRNLNNSVAFRHKHLSKWQLVVTLVRSSQPVCDCFLDYPILSAFLPVGGSH